MDIPKQHTEIPGYDYGNPSSARSPVSLEELRQLEASATWSEEDISLLQKHRRIFEDRAEDMVDSWRDVIGSQPHLARWFFGPNGKPDEDYKAKVKKRFVQWVRDAVRRPHDQTWLNYQEEIGQRHTPEKKNRTDNVDTASLVPLRYLYAFTVVVALAARKFFAEAGVDGDELQKLQDAWLKTVVLHVVLWSRPYTKEGLW